MLQYFGDPMDCQVDGLRKDMMDMYCWSTGTYTAKEYFHERREFVRMSILQYSSTR